MRRAGMKLPDSILIIVINEVKTCGAGLWTEANLGWDNVLIANNFINFRCRWCKVRNANIGDVLSIIGLDAYSSISAPRAEDFLGRMLY